MHILKLVGFIALGLYLLLAGLADLGFTFSGELAVLGILGILAGAFILIATLSKCCSSGCCNTNYKDKH
jgi:hypothetical protein